MESSKSSSQEDLCQELTTIHALELVRDDMDLLYQITIDQLKLIGINVLPSVKRRESRAKSRTPVLSRRNTATSGYLNELDEVRVNKFHNVSVHVPKFLSIMCNFIKDHLDEQGLFRVAGASTRINSLINTLDDTEKGFIDSGASVFDVCSALKQLIRKLDDPLIPPSLHYVFLRCLELPKDQRSSANLLAIFLLPKFHLHIILYLIEFLHEVAAHSEHNKMDARNLAIVFAPNIMPLTSIPTKKSGKDCDENSCSDFINNHVEIVKMLIEAGDRIGLVSNSMAGDIVAALCKNSEDELESDDRDIRKRKRSSSLNRALTSAAGVLEFICKKKSKKFIQNPSDSGSLTNTPGDLNTPIIKSRSRKRSSDTAAATPVSTSTRNRIISLMNKKKYLAQTPNTPGNIGYPSPAVSLNPRPTTQDDIQSATLKTNALRISRTIQRVNASKSLPETSYVSGKEPLESIMQIVPLANSPKRRSQSPQYTADVSLLKPPPAPTYTPNCSRSGDNSCDDPMPDLEDPTLRFTPMVREIKELTLAALREESPTPSVTPTPPNTCSNEAETFEMAVEEHVHVTTAVPANLVLNLNTDRNCRTTRSKFRSEARRCQSFNDAFLAKGRRGTPHIPRRKSDGTTMVLRGRRKLSSVSNPYPVGQVQQTAHAQSLITLNRSPTRCTLRRGRPNTTRAGLPRPSPSTNPKGLQSQLFLPPDNTTPINITLDRKGRVSRRVFTRPALIIPATCAMENNPENKPGVVKPPRMNLKVTKLQSPKSRERKLEGLCPAPEHLPAGWAAVQLPTQLAQPLSYVTSKLKREVNGTVKLAIEETPVISKPTTPANNRKGRSFSMRSDMIRPSPNNQQHSSPYRSSSKKIPNYNEKSLNILESRCKPMKRGSSVQELVRKFDNKDLKPAFATLRRESKIGTLPLPGRNKAGTGEVIRAVPPAKPPRTNVFENGIYKAKSKQQFNSVTGNPSNTVNSRGSNQVLKTINLP